MKQVEKSSSGTRTLAQKLGIKPDMKTFFIHPPDDYFTWLQVDQTIFTSTDSTQCQFAHLFLNTTDDLEFWLNDLRNKINPAGMIWVSWYKKASGIPSELTEDIIRDTALAIGLVDIKVCSVNEEWSGLKLVIRKNLR